MNAPWTDQELINAAKMYARITQRIDGLPQGFLGESVAGATITLAAAGTLYATGSTVTVTLTQQRRLRVTGASTYQLATTTIGRAVASLAYKSGGSFGTDATTLGFSASISNGGGGAVAVGSGLTGTAEGSILLPAGTYTFGLLVQRANNGSTTDKMANHYVAVYDEGGA